MRKCWRFVLSLSVLVALLFSGCAKDNPPDSGAESTDAESASETGTVEELPDPLRLVSDGKSDYVIIYPEGASSNVMRAVRNLQSQIKDYTGAALEAQDDYLKKGQTVSAAQHQPDYLRLSQAEREQKEKEARLPGDAGV